MEFKQCVFENTAEISTENNALNEDNQLTIVNRSFQLRLPK